MDDDTLALSANLILSATEQRKGGRPEHSFNNSKSQMSHILAGGPSILSATESANKIFDSPKGNLLSKQSHSEDEQLKHNQV